MGFEGLVISALSISESTILGTEDEFESESEEEIELTELSELLELSKRIGVFMDKDSESVSVPTDNNTLELLCGLTVIDTLDPDNRLKPTYFGSKGVWLI
jgi:hypothetical protein